MTSKRQAITIETKYEIIKHHQGGKKLAFLVKEFNLPQSTVSTILKNKERTISQYENNAIPSTKRIKLSTYPLLETAIDSWFKQTMTQSNVAINGPIIQLQAIKYATFLGYTDFKASNGWITNFKKRNNISYKTISGEAGLVDNAVVERYISTTLPILIEEFKAENIYNADETALFYKAMPSKTMFFTGEKCNSVKENKERLSLLLAANMDGSDKLVVLK